MEIKILDENTINKIAAGEVVERPASIIKELVENSIDANATKIIIEIEDAGKKSIKVTDNGYGMDKKNLLMSFKNHSTSKISMIDDLERLNTLGFRGEALSSICAVSKVEILSKTFSQLIGTKIKVLNGDIKKIEDIGINVGTTIIVKDLFYNVPARKKFLKSTRTEFSHIIDIVTNLSIANTQIYFKLLHNGKEILSCPSNTDFSENIVNIFGKDIAKDLIHFEHNDDYLKISGYIGKPSVTTKNQKMQFFYVNKRYVKSYLISNILKDAYKSYLQKGQFPIAFLFIDINPKLIDVNVHPTKRIIKFADERDIYHSVFSGIADALESSFLAPEITISKKESKLLFDDKLDVKKKNLFIKEKIGFRYSPRIGKKISDSKRMLENEDLKTKIPEIEIIGQFANTYIIAKNFTKNSEENLLIIDQHAAHEKIIYEQLIKTLENKTKQTQNLLSPKVLELSLKEKVMIEKYIEILKDIGFSIEEFGGNSYIIKSVPVVMGRLESTEIIHEIIEDLTTLGIVRETSILKEKIAQIVACHSAVRGGDVLTFAQMNDLIKQLRNANNPFNCPHGRPSMIVLSKKELEKKFKRV